MVVSSAGAGTQRQCPGLGSVAPQLVVAAAGGGGAGTCRGHAAPAAHSSAVGQLLGAQQLLVLGDAQSLAVDHARPLRTRPPTQHNTTAVKINTKDSNT